MLLRDRAYALKTWDKPPTIETYRVHPFMKQVDGSSEAGEQPQTAAAAETSQTRQSDAGREGGSRRFGQISLDTR